MARSTSTTLPPPGLASSQSVFALEHSDAFREDTTTASFREIFGWYMFDVASAPFGISILVALMPDLLTRTAEACVESDGNLHAGAIRISPGSLFPFTISASVFVQVIFYAFLGAYADFGGLRRRLLLLFSILGSIFTLALVIVGPDTCSISWWMGSIFVLLANVCFGVCFVFYNAYLPLLVRYHPRVAEVRNKLESGEVNQSDLLDKERKDCENRLSSIGFLSGYCVAFGVLIVNVIVFIMLKDQMQVAFRINILIAALFWGFLGVWSILQLRVRPGPAVPKDESRCFFSLVRAYKTLKKAKLLPNAFKFLLAFFIYSDSYSTITYSAALFAREELGFSPTELALLVMEVEFFGIFGCWIWYLLSRKHLQRKTIILINLFFVCAIPVYAIIYLRSKIELYVLGSIFAFQVGSVQAFSRAVFAELIPRGLESEFFSFYAITDRGTSWLGPLLFGLVQQFTGSMRLAIFSIIIFVIVGAPLLYIVDIEAGRREAKSFGAVMSDGFSDREIEMQTVELLGDEDVTNNSEIFDDTD